MFERDDKDILELYRQEGGADRAFNLIVRAYSRKLYWHIREMVASHEDTDDILQNTFIKVWNNLPKFRGDSGLYTWIYRIATNESLTFLKKERLSGKFSFTPFETKLANRLTTEGDFTGDEIQLALQKQVMALPDKQRAIFSMRYFQEMEYNDIAEIMESNIGAVKASYSVAYSKIASNLKKEF
ncbi:MAG: RNA polymerase sigma factor [Candidatus Egerieousia sp.]